MRLIGYAMLLLVSQAAPPAPVGPRLQNQHSASSTQESKNAVGPRPDERLANYTLWLTRFTGVLAALTLGLLYVAYKQGQQLEREFLASHRPKLRIRKVEFNEGTDDKEAAIEAVIANIGDSTATVLDAITADWDGEASAISPNAQHPSVPQHDQIRRVNAGVSQRVLKSGETALLRHEGSDSFLQVRYDKRRAAQYAKPLMFLCVVRYADDLGTKRETSTFRWLCETYPATRLLEAYENDYNYED